MRKLSHFVAFLLILFLCLPVSAQNTSFDAGEVLYHQDFSAVTDISASGVTMGTSASPQTMISVAGDSLDLITKGGGRVYALFPRFAKGDTYTAEFSFSFSEIGAENGYLAYILTSRGVEPTNISSIIVRADGTVDDFDELPRALADAVSSGETVNVKIPISGGALYQIMMEYDGNEYVLERDSLLVITDGNIGFAARNASASVGEVYVVGGVDYDALKGYYADHSFATDGIPANRNDGEEYSPATCDPVLFACAAATVTLISVTASGKRK